MFGLNLWSSFGTFVIVNSLELWLIFGAISDMQNWGALIFSVIILINTDIFLFLTATKDPAMIPSRHYLKDSRVQDPKFDLPPVIDRNKYLDIIGANLVKIKYC